MTPREKPKAGSPAPAASWLLLIHQLPPKPAYLRVKIWRRLQGLGAISVKGSVYVLPAGEQALEDFQWLLREIEEGGGEGAICEASLIDGLSDQEVKAQFDTARDEDYAEIATELRALAAEIRGGSAPIPDRKPEAKAKLVRLRHRYSELSEIDFFGATGRLTVEALLTEIERSLTEAQSDQKAEDIEVKTASEDLTGKTWVTRSGVHVDRIACAWLIRRFIDPQARFKFVAAKDYGARPGELRFDMFKGEFTHEGDKCSFEVLLERVGLNDKALRAISEIVHDIDLKDSKFGREEATGIASLIAGIAAAASDDEKRLAQGAPVFDNLYQYFRTKRR